MKINLIRLVIRPVIIQSFDQRQPILRLMMRAKTFVMQAFGQEKAVAIVQPDDALCARRPCQRRELERAKARAEVMENQHRVIAPAPQPPRQRQRLTQIGGLEQRLRTVKRVLVEGDDLMHEIAMQYRRGVLRRQHGDVCIGKGVAQVMQSGRTQHQVANIGKLLLSTQIYDMHRLAHEVSGGLIVALPGPDEDHNPATAATLAEVLRANPDIPYDKRIEVARFMEDLTASYQGGWYSLISLHGGGSPAALKQEIWRNYPVGDKVDLVERLLDRGVLADEKRSITRNRQPGRCCDAGCSQPGQAVMVPLPATATPKKTGGTS